MKKIYKKVLFCIFLIAMVLLIKTKVEAATVNISVSPSTVTVGQSCKITITGSGAAVYDIVANISGAGVSEKIYLNAYSDDLQNVTKSASKTITPTSTGTITVSIASSSNITVAGASGSQSITCSSKSITVKEKEVEVEEPKIETPTNTTKPTTKPSTKPTTTQKTTQTKVEENDIYISSITLKGIKENGETIDISLSPEFNKDVYDYTCNIQSDIQKIELEKDAGNYTDSIIITGLEDLKEGENIITLMLAVENHKAKTYTIKAVKEEKVLETLSSNIETNEDIEDNKNNSKKEQVMISMPLWVFILLQIGIVVIEIIIMIIIMKIKKSK